MTSVSVKKNQTKRVLVTGLSTYWGGRLAQALEQDSSIDTIIGVDSKEPTCELQRTEFVKISNQHSLIRRIVDAVKIDTVVDARLVVDSLLGPTRAIHENNVIGTMNILAACSGPSPVRKYVFKSSAHYYGCEQDDPAFFSEEMRRPHEPRTSVERDIVEAESAVAGFSDQHPDVDVSVVRFVNVLGPSIKTSHIRLFSLPMVPAIFGFDPRYQFIHEDDVVGVLSHFTRHQLPGIFNAGADGTLCLSEVADLLDKRLLPVLPPRGSGTAFGLMRRAGLRLPSEAVNQLKFGRAVDNRKLKASAYRFKYTTREAVESFAEHLRLNPFVLKSQEPYRYEREVEEFLRWSPSVRTKSKEFSWW